MPGKVEKSESGMELSVTKSNSEEKSPDISEMTSLGDSKEERKNEQVVMETASNQMGRSNFGYKDPDVSVSCSKTFIKNNVSQNDQNEKLYKHEDHEMDYSDVKYFSVNNDNLENPFCNQEGVVKVESFTGNVNNVNENIDLNVEREKLVHRISDKCLENDPSLPEFVERLAFEYEDVLNNKIGTIKDFVYEFKVKNDIPFCEKPYKLNRTQKKEMKIIIDELIKEGVLVEMDTPYRSPSFIVTNSDGSKRLITNFSRLGGLIDFDPVECTNADESVSILAKGNVFTKIDLRRSFFQLNLDPSCIKYTGFALDDKVYCYKKLPMGVSVSMCALVRAVHKMLGDLREDRLSFTLMT